MGPCPVPGCTEVIDTDATAVCLLHQTRVPPYWVKRWKKAVKAKAASKVPGTTVSKKLTAFREVEFVRATCIGATLKVLPLLVLSALFCGCSAGGHTHAHARALDIVDIANICCGIALVVAQLIFTAAYQG